MKTTFTTLIIFLSMTFANAQILEVLFFDDFEDEIVNDRTFLHWTTEDLAGDSYWEHIPSSATNKTQVARFETNNEINNDWIVSKQIVTNGMNDIIIHFRHRFSGDRVKPKLMYTNQFNGNTNESEWYEIDYILGENENRWQSATGSKNVSGNTFFIALNFETSENDSISFLFDSFEIKGYNAPPSDEMVGASEHFEFFTDISGESDYWLEIKDTLEANFQKYCGIWNNIWNTTDFINKAIKTKIYYTEKSNIPLVNSETPDTKSGFFDRETKVIYLSPLNTNEKTDYYQNLEGLAINTFAGYAKKHQLYRDKYGNDEQPDYFIEGFGLYEQGFHPRLDSIIKARAEHPNDFTYEDLDKMNVFEGTSAKDIIASYVEAQIVGLLDYNASAQYGSFTKVWNNHLVYFYDTTNVVRIQKYASSDKFDIYCSSRDTMFIDSFFVWLDRTQQLYIDSFQIEVNRKNKLVIYYDEKTGMDMTGFDNWNGGAGGLNISPHNFPGGIDGYPWLLAHEFGHVYTGLLGPGIPMGFYHEGMANFSGFIQYGADWAENRYYIEFTLYNFYKEYSREPTLEEFFNNPYYGTDLHLDPYYYGLEFIRYLYELDGMLKIKEFFANSMDFSVFSQSYEEIEAGYMKRLKRYRYLYPKDTLINIPFDEKFNDFSFGWTKPSYTNQDNWQIDEGGKDGTNCAKFYTSSDKNEPIESWLVSPQFNASEMENINFSFDFARYGEGIEIDLFYTHKFEGYTNSTDWTTIKSLELPVDWNWSNTGNISITSLSDTIFIGIRMKSTGEQHQQLNIDNFKVNGIKTASEIIELSNNLHVYPNPVSSNSVISFQTENTTNVELSIFDIKGRKFFTLLNEKLNAGNHEFPVGKYLTTRGIYLCRLKTKNNVSTLKLIVD